jgi:hypothetical protein
LTFWSVVANSGAAGFKFASGIAGDNSIEFGVSE